MTIRFPSALSAKHILRRSNLFANHAAAATSLDVPKGHFAVYVGEGEKKRFVIPVSYLNQPSFQQLLNIAEEEFGFTHPMDRFTMQLDFQINLQEQEAHRDYALHISITWPNAE
ncbi:Auxin-responsive protein SAUR20, partial [Mucuna pruriens]